MSKSADRSRRAALCALAGLLALTAPGPARGASPEPNWTLDRPDAPGAIFVVAHASLGGTVGYDVPRPGGGISLLFRPRAASELLAPLYDWNTGLVVQGDWRSVSRDRRLLSLGLVLRRYLDDRRAAVAGASPFIGAGLGVAQGNSPDLAPVRSWLWLAEAGWETSPSPATVLFLRIELHAWRGGGLDYSGWSLQLGAGVPVPW